MTGKIPFAGHKRSELKPYDGKRHSLNTIELAFRVRCIILDELNEAYLADPTSTNFAEFMRKIVNLGMEAYRAKHPSPVSDVQSRVART